MEKICSWLNTHICVHLDMLNIQRCVAFPSILHTDMVPPQFSFTYRASRMFHLKHSLIFSLKVKSFFPFKPSVAVSRWKYTDFVFICTSLKSSSLRCCFLRSIFFTATCLPLCFSLAMHTIPVEPSPILMKLSRYSRGSPADGTRCGTALKEHYEHDIVLRKCNRFPPGLTTS